MRQRRSWDDSYVLRQPPSGFLSSDAIPSLKYKTEEKLTAMKCALLSTAGVIVYDAPLKNIYPLAVEVRTRMKHMWKDQGGQLY